MNDLDVITKKLGFESSDEFCKLVASVDISTPQNTMAFRRWQVNDGTKEGLLKLPTKNSDHPATAGPTN